MRLAILCLLVLPACDRLTEDAADSSKTPRVPYVVPYNGDPERFTSSGFPADRWEVKECNLTIPLKPPFRASEGGFGDLAVRVPLAVLDDPRITHTTAENTSLAQARLSFIYPSRYKGVGIKEGIPLKAPVMPLEDAPRFLASPTSRHTNGMGGESTYFGEVKPGRELAMICGATNWPNPLCYAEVEIGSKGRRYYIELPPRAAARLRDIVTVGDSLFTDAERRCDKQR